MRRFVVIGILCAAALANCAEETETSAPMCADPPCDDTCVDPPCDDTCADPPCDDTCADPPCDDTCADPPCDDTCADPPCDPPAFAFVHVPITIDDPIVNGTSLMTPVDGISFAYATPTATDGGFITSFGRDFNDPSQTFLWHLDEGTATHQKRPLSGTVFSPTANLCAGEDWCQLIGRDGGDWVIVGPAADDVMRVTATFEASLSPVSGPRPPTSFINHSHRFVPGELFLFGATGPSGFSDTVSALTLSSGTWRSVATGLPQTDDNCLAYSVDRTTLFSVAGRTTSDGGNTTQTLSTLTSIDVVTGTFTTSDLPTGIGVRRGMSCVFDPTRGLLYAFGGADIVDNFNDAQNQFHNDLWAYDVAADTWTQLIEDTPGGMLGEPDSFGDQRFEGDPTGPNFGRSRGHMQLDRDADRLLLIGAVPIFTHEQLYVLPLEGIDQLL